MKEIFNGVFQDNKKLYTKSRAKNASMYAKNVIKVNKETYREWDPNKSKPAAAIRNGLKKFPLDKKIKILYLGIASGTTSSFFSDIIGDEGIIYGVEISERSIRDLNEIAEDRGNIIPILADARKPEEYDWVEPVDLVYQDVASDDQTPIIIRNAKKFLNKNGYAIIAIKARSIDVTKEPWKVYKEQIEKLKNHFRIIEKVELEPFEIDHMLVLMKAKIKKVMKNDHKTKKSSKY